METLTIEIKNPKVRELIANLADMDLIAVLPQQPTWAERWQALSDSLPDVPQITEQDILDEIKEVRQSGVSRQ
ncbi:hypothetical protein [Persicitalea sp.]|uniref:hypothetical protein n=1 Tax=Persicitalea sp. TaxID=3100273 RepID=UPI0035938427